METLDDIQQTIEAIKNSMQVFRGWYYAPSSATRDFLSGEISEHPYPRRVFSLPFTHRIRHETDDSQAHLDFLIWCLGFFEGMRLSTSTAGYLDSTPIEKNKLTDFILTGGSNIGNAIEVAERYWIDNYADQRQIKRLTGIIHCLFLAQNPNNLHYERFTYLYMALDACFKATSEIHVPPSRLSHAMRLEWTCQQFGMPVPSWATRLPGQPSEVSWLRNDTMHEALFFDEPLGFAVYRASAGPGAGANVLLQMEALTCRLIVALLGKQDTDYVRSSVDTRQQHGLRLG